MKKKLYLLVSKDEYELPLAVCDSVYELSERAGATENTIRSALSHYKNDGVNCPYRQVEVELED